MAVVTALGILAIRVSRGISLVPVLLQRHRDSSPDFQQRRKLRGNEQWKCP